MDKREKNAFIEELVQKCQAGDKDAFAELYDLFVDPLYRYVYYRAERTDAEDLLEIVFLKIWEKITTYKPTHSFSAWAFRIAHNTLIDYYRTRKTVDSIDPELHDTSDAQNPVIQTEKSLEGELVHAAIRSLKEPYRQIVTLRFIEDLDYEEIAHIIGKNEGNIRVMVHRALAQLRERLKQDGISF